MIFIVVAAAALLGLVIYRAGEFYNSALPEMAGVFTAGIGILTLIVMLIVAGATKATVQGDLAQAAQLRQAAASVDLQASEDVAGKVADFNQALAAAKWQNKQWWGDAFVPDEWDSVAYIPVR